MYTCSGICRSSLFFYSLPTTFGTPDQTCLIFLKLEIRGSLNALGIVAIVTGCIMGFVWCCQYSLWRAYENEEENSHAEQRDLNY